MIEAVVIGVAALLVLYAVVFVGLKSLFSLRHVGRTFLEPRKTVIVETHDQAVARLHSCGWNSTTQRIGADAYFSNGPLRVVVSSSPNGTTTMVFLGFSCHTSEAARLNQQLESVFG